MDKQEDKLNIVGEPSSIEWKVYHNMFASEPIAETKSEIKLCWNLLGDKCRYKNRCINYVTFKAQHSTDTFNGVDARHIQDN